MILFIDTSKSTKATVKLKGKKFTCRSGLGAGQEVLSLIEKALKTEKANFSDLKEIRVNLGPGSFTGLKVGVTIANFLGYLLKIPVNGQIITKEKILLPTY